MERPENKWAGANGTRSFKDSFNNRIEIVLLYFWLKHAVQLQKDLVKVNKCIHKFVHGLALIV